MISPCSGVALVARAARSEIEETLGVDVARWPWRARLSFYVDLLVTIEEGGA